MKMRIFSLCTVMILFSVCANAQLDRVELIVIDGVPNEAIKQTIEQSASTILSAFNETIIQGKGKVKFADEQLATKDGIRILQELWHTSAMICPISRISEHCNTLTSGGYQIRNVPITLLAATDPDEEEQDLVLNFTKDGKLDNIMISMENHRYVDIISHNVSVTDLHCRQAIVDFIENFRTAYNRKDIDYLSLVYSDDALIITGKVVKQALPAGQGKTDLPNYCNNFTPQKIEYFKETKAEYIAKLRNCFRKNKFINVGFEDMEVMRHPKKSNVYGVTLKQHWNSDTYSDVGYLFLLIDFEDETKPSIQVRTWQPEEFDGRKINRDEVLSISDFSL